MKCTVMVITLVSILFSGVSFGNDSDTSVSDAMNTASLRISAEQFESVRLGDFSIEVGWNTAWMPSVDVVSYRDVNRFQHFEDILEALAKFSSACAEIPNAEEIYLRYDIQQVDQKGWITVIRVFEIQAVITEVNEILNRTELSKVDKYYILKGTSAQWKESSAVADSWLKEYSGDDSKK